MWPGLPQPENSPDVNKATQAGFSVQVIVHGPAYSTYTRTVRLALEEKQVEYELRPVDFLSGQNRLPAHLARNPFGKVPVLEHGELTLYETAAILHYLEYAFPEPALQPANGVQHARMLEMSGSICAYVYPLIVGQIAVERLVKPAVGKAADEVIVKKAAERVPGVLRAVEAKLEQPFLLGAQLSLADLYLVPMWDYFLQTPEGQAIGGAMPKLRRWWVEMERRASVTRTRAPILAC